ncbi:MAG: EpsG family protein [Oscillospiraceae bacterium]|nr:EpsG family protein [Oscillospiraceae bacterium]
MAVYLLGFALSLALIAIAQKKRTAVFWILSAIALLIPCLIAGLRARHIGTDVMVYVKQLTHSAIISDDLGEYFRTYWYYSWKNVYVQEYDLGFSFLVYVVGRLTNNLGCVLFAIQAIMVIPIYLALSRNRKQFPIWIGMLVYYLFFYNTTLNMMRQWVAMAFLLLAFQLLSEKKVWLTALFTVVAFLFHTTSVIAIPLYGVYWLLRRVEGVQFVQNRLRISAPMMVVMGLGILSVVALFCMPLIIKILGLIGLSKFNNYLEGDKMRIVFTQIVLRLPLFCLLILNWRDLSRKTKLAPFFAAMLVFDTVASQLVSIDAMAFRIANYFALFQILWLPPVCSCHRNRGVRVISTILLVGYCLVYWYFIYVMELRHETYPYVSIL